MTVYHKPVLLNQCIEAMQIKTDGVYVDLTFGGGGHSRYILEKLGENGRLYSFDQDPDAAANAEMIDDPRFTFIDANFRFLQKYLRLYGVTKVDAILGDLGVSSHQLDDASRGFSFKHSDVLDMRMDKMSDFTAQHLINEYSADEIAKVLRNYGEVSNAWPVAQAIVRTRSAQPIATVGEFIAILEHYAPRFKEYKYYAQVFQAIRIEVNAELEVLKEMIEQLPLVLKEDGLVVIMSYHSLEDRLVKDYIHAGNFNGEQEKDLYGNVLRPLEPVSRKAIIPSDEEIEQNPRARSAKLRVAKRNKYTWPRTK